MKFLRYMLMMLVLLSIEIGAQAQERPLPRTSAHMFYDEKNKYVILLDGESIEKDSMNSEIWRWSNNQWQKEVKVARGARSLSGCAIDRSKNWITCFGGVGHRGYDSKKADVWQFDGSEWSVRATSTSIGTRDHHKMVFSERLNGFVIYGGLTEDRKYDTVTWIYRDNIFEPLNIPGPGGRAHFGMVYDNHRGKVVLYGGIRPDRSYANDVWEFDGIKWEKMKSDTSIGTRVQHTMIYHPELRSVIVQGGLRTRWVNDKNVFDYPSETIGWDGKEWKVIAAGGPSSILPAMVFDGSKQAVLYFSGAGAENKIFDFMWELKNGRWQKHYEQAYWQWDRDQKKFVKAK